MTPVQNSHPAGTVKLSSVLHLIFFLFAAMGLCVEAASPFSETKAQRDQRMTWFRQARFGMFIHWGLYALPGGEWKGKPVDGIGEWIMNNGHIPVADYEKLATQFNPIKFNATEWVRIAKD